MTEESPTAQSPEEIQFVLDEALAKGILEEPMSPEGIQYASIVERDGGEVLVTGIFGDEEEELATAYANGDLLTGSDDFLRSIGKEASNALGLLCDRDACVALGSAGNHLVHPAEGWV